VRKPVAARRQVAQLVSVALRHLASVLRSFLVAMEARILPIVQVEELAVEVLRALTVTVLLVAQKCH